ncbi:MAG: AAA family ATPase [Saprospiraceae bacterium]|nr:AAA family ATPase [Saprospiraceae bacterium]MBK8853546.1 AAA family ATPase [Saprospiraceae bacterium]
MDRDRRYEKILDAIEDERKAEESFFQSLHSSKTLQEKVDQGFIWYPIEIVAVHYAIGESVEIKIKRKTAPGKDFFHKFKVGVSVQFFNSDPNVKNISGVVSYLQKDTISVLTYVEKEDVEDFYSGHSGLEIIYDDKSYQVMKSAIRQVMDSKNESVQVLRKAFISQSLPDNRIYGEDSAFIISGSTLNLSQKKALEIALSSRYLSIIHGPPGTGKTTTLVALTKTILQKEKKILVCASSNNAVDLLASRLHLEGLRVLRIGNVTRIHDDLVDLTLIEKLRNHADWNTIKKIKIQADQILRTASKYKRSFTPEDKAERKRLKKESYDLRSWSRELEDRLSDEILSNTQVIATTLISASHPQIQKMVFETVIIDEASQALEAECWNAILKGKRVILAGDHLQLPPTVKSQEAMQKGFDKTILDFMTDKIEESSLLTVQYRMNDTILGFSNRQFYKGMLESFPTNKNISLPNDDLPLVFIDTAGCGFDEILNPKQKSYKNEGEYFILREYILKKHEILAGAEIGIISPYAEQVRYVSDEIEKEPAFIGLNLEVNTIDGFQGQEKDVIFISLVRSNDKSELGFIKDNRRLNVAMTRARKKLVIIGDSATIGNHPLYNELLNHIEKNGFLDSAWNYMML